MNRKLRQVRFNDHEQIQEIDSFAADQKDALWYSRQDLNVLRERQVQDADSCDCASLFSPFGEHRQKEFVTELLRQQSEHRLMGFLDPKGLFQLSRSHSKKSTQQAVKSAQAQEREVKQYFATSKEQTLRVLDDALALLDEPY